MEFHFDSIKVSELREDEKGYLKVKGTIARVGDLTYLNADGTTRVEYVPPETLFDKAHLDSIGNSDFVEGHPAMINADNYRRFTIGSVGSNVFANAIKNDNDEIIDGDVQVFYTIKHKDAVKKVKQGLVRGLSMGYSVQVKRNDDGKYIQVKRICNHHGLVESPRCRGANLHLDSSDNIWINQTEHHFDSEIIKPIIKPVKLFFFADYFSA